MAGLSTLNGLEPLGLDEYDTPTPTLGSGFASGNNGAVPFAADAETDAAAAATQMEENLGVEDLGVDDVLQTKIRRPVPKLDAQRLLNPHRGYPFLIDHLKKIPYRGKGDEKRYLKKYVNTYLIWANRLWPKANFDDFTVLARKAGRDPRVRQYCRELIEEEKYGGASVAAADSSAAHRSTGGDRAGDDRAITDPDLAGVPSSAAPSASVPASSPATYSALVADGSVSQLPEDDEDAAAAAAAGAASPPPNWDDGPQSPSFGGSPPADFGEGPDEDEEAAAMELYGDLGL